MRSAILLACLLTGLSIASIAGSEEASGTRPLRTIRSADLKSILPQDTHLLIEASAIEQFLAALDGSPPAEPTKEMMVVARHRLVHPSPA